MAEPFERKRVLILCTGNSCRSQIAEHLWNRLFGERWQAFSAGSAPTGRVHPLAVEVLREIHIDAAGAESKSLDEFAGQPFDLLVTVCGDADASCPRFAGASERLHWPFPDPAGGDGDRPARLSEFRGLRDAIAVRIEEHVAAAAA